MLDPTPIIRPVFLRRAKRFDLWASASASAQLKQLHGLLTAAAATETGRAYGFGDMLDSMESRGGARGLVGLYENFRNRLSPRDYEDIRPQVMRMVDGATDVLWPGRCFNYAQSSGTSGGRSKFIPVTDDSLKSNHFAGGADTVASYLRLNPKSRMFAGRGFILGGSFATELRPADPRVKVGDLSATLISKIPPFGGVFRVPDRETALMENWEDKLPALARKAAGADITNISGVPSWFFTVLKKICALRGTDRISDVWPNLEVFFHGGISFAPYRDLYRSITDDAKMHYLETYNASEGFFAVQTDFDDPGLMLLLDNGVFFEFLAPGSSYPVPVWEVREGEVYELLITACNGLWRYRLGDTVRITSTHPVKVTLAGRTQGFINAFGEELMEDNADKAIAETCRQTGAVIRNYSAAPYYAGSHHRGRHQWAVEWEKAPQSAEDFARRLDDNLRRLNSDYDAKRAHTIFLDPLEVITLPDGAFDLWLQESGSGKLGGQRKVPRLSNSRHILDALLQTADKMRG